MLQEECLQDVGLGIHLMIEISYTLRGLFVQKMKYQRSKIRHYPMIICNSFALLLDQQ
jgi:hypothetical protein